MGLYTDVHVCIRRGAPLDAETRARVVDAAAFAVGGGCPRWEGRVGEGGFVFLASQSPVAVRLFNLHRPPAARPKDDGFVGEFFDVATLSLRSGPDGRTLSRSPFVKRLKKELGLEVTCRSSSW